ncbi:thiamine phosphate synthase [Formosa sp. S-31]|uniref:thiamine phosphate synthase n=1 Tax=Formosa sp. S-31 TaxID=2790949 RepID=UPI003EB7A189
MLVLFSPPENHPNEQDLLQDMFCNGLAVYHLRKPGISLEVFEEYLNAVDQKYHNRIVLHNHHEISQVYNVKGIHFKEFHREQLENKIPEYAKVLRKSGKTISSSFHNLDALNQCSVEFDYQFLSPVFNSISKSGYTGKGFHVQHCLKKLIALGGVHVNRLQEVLELGYAGAAVLGAVWESDNPVTSFKDLQQRMDILTQR